MLLPLGTQLGPSLPSSSLSSSPPPPPLGLPFVDGICPRSSSRSCWIAERGNPRFSRHPHRPCYRPHRRPCGRPHHRPHHQPSHQRYRRPCHRCPPCHGPHNRPSCRPCCQPTPQGLLSAMPAATPPATLAMPLGSPNEKELGTLSSMPRVLVAVAAVLLQPAQPLQPAGRD